MWLCIYFNREIISYLQNSYNIALNDLFVMNRCVVHILIFWTFYFPTKLTQRRILRACLKIKHKLNKNIKIILSFILHYTYLKKNHNVWQTCYLFLLLFLNLSTCQYWLWLCRNFYSVTPEQRGQWTVESSNPTSLVLEQGVHAHTANS